MAGLPLPRRCVPSLPPEPIKDRSRLRAHEASVSYLTVSLMQTRTVGFTPVSDRWPLCEDHAYGGRCTEYFVTA
jgi:hypothetical protein